MWLLEASAGCGLREARAGPLWLGQERPALIHPHASCRSTHAGEMHLLQSTTSAVRGVAPLHTPSHTPCPVTNAEGVSGGQVKLAVPGVRWESLPPTSPLTAACYQAAAAADGLMKPPESIKKRHLLFPFGSSQMLF